MANVCDNNLTVEGSPAALQALADWINAQQNEQAPTSAWAALYNLEREANSTDGIGDVGSGWADHAYGDADFSLHGTSAAFQWVSKNNPSIDAVMLLARKFPGLSFQFEYEEPGYALSGQLTCQNGVVTSFEGGYDEDDDSEWDSDEDSDESPI